MTADEDLSMLTERTGRPIDLSNLNATSEPLLRKIVRHSRRILDSDTLFGDLISRDLFEQVDFMPYRTRLLAERRLAWIGK